MNKAIIPGDATFYGRKCDECKRAYVDCDGASYYIGTGPIIQPLDGTIVCEEALNDIDFTRQIDGRPPMVEGEDYRRIATN